MLKHRPCTLCASIASTISCIFSQHGDICFSRTKPRRGYIGATRGVNCREAKSRACCGDFVQNGSRCARLTGSSPKNIFLLQKRRSGLSGTLYAAPYAVRLVKHRNSHFVLGPTFTTQEVQRGVTQRLVFPKCRLSWADGHSTHLGYVEPESHTRTNDEGDKKP